MQIPKEEESIYVNALAYRLSDIYLSNLTSNYNSLEKTIIYNVREKLLQNIVYLPKNEIESINKNIESIIDSANSPAPCYDTHKQIFKYCNDYNINRAVKSFTIDEDSWEYLIKQFTEGGKIALELANNKELARINWVECAKNYIDPHEYDLKKEIRIFEKQNLDIFSLDLNGNKR